MACPRDPETSQRDGNWRKFTVPKNDTTPAQTEPNYVCIYNTVVLHHRTLTDAIVQPQDTEWSLRAPECELRGW
jgi:hypothetical protein